MKNLDDKLNELDVTPTKRKYIKGGVAKYKYEGKKKPSNLKKPKEPTPVVDLTDIELKIERLEDHMRQHCEVISELNDGIDDLEDNLQEAKDLGDVSVYKINNKFMALYVSQIIVLVIITIYIIATLWS